MRDEAPHTDDYGADKDDCRAGTRNRYFRGKTLKADDFEKEQRYFIGRRRLITRSALGWGVVYGLAVEGSPGEPYRKDDAYYEDPTRNPDGQGTPNQSSQADDDAAYGSAAPKCAEPKAITVGAGLALDRHGREIDLHGERSLGVNNVFLVEEDASGCRTRPLDKIAPGRYLLSIHYAERRFGDASLPDGCDCDDPEKNYVCETAVFSLRGIRKCPCGEKPCNRTCTCGARSRCGYGSRGSHACLCEWTADSAETNTTPLCEWRGYWIDPADGVPLACVVVEVQQGKCDLEIVGCIEDDCSPRRLVKSNDLLYDLIRGCDLAHISWVSWADWHRGGKPSQTNPKADRRMPWSDFEKMFTSDGRTEFIVRFSEPVLTATLKRDVIMITVVTREPGTGWRVPRRIPIIDLDLTANDELPEGYQTLPDGTTNQMRVLVRPRWVKDEVEKGGESWLGERQFRIEVEIYGDYILDCHRQSIDANAVGLKAAPTGNGTPGGTYRSNFRVEPQQQATTRDHNEA